MIYRAGLVACTKLIIGNARLFLQPVQSILFPALRSSGKPGWPATRLPLVFNVNGFASAALTGRFTTNEVWITRKGQELTAILQSIIQI